MLPEFRLLAWRHADPATRPTFDPTGVDDLVRSLPPAAEIPPPGADWRLNDSWYDRMTAALVERLGDWVVGWRYTASTEVGKTVWHAQYPQVKAPDETLTGLAASVMAWHEYLIGCAADPRGWTDQDKDIRYPPSRPRRLPHPTGLRWAQVHLPNLVLDEETVHALASDLVAAADLPSSATDWRLRDLWLENVSAGFTDRFGLWAVGWR